MLVKLSVVFKVFVLAKFLLAFFLKKSSLFLFWMILSITFWMVLSITLLLFWMVLSLELSLQVNNVLLEFTVVLISVSCLIIKVLLNLLL